jgi:putative transposase
MANTFTSLHYHVVFSTKHRERWIAPDIEERVWSYIAGVAGQHGMEALIVGGLDDHLHVVIGIPSTIPVSRAVQLLKGASSRWIRQTFPQLEAFGWQEGYGAFTVSKSALLATISYVERQRERHLRQTYQEEFRALLDRYEIAYDERYLWTEPSNEPRIFGKSRSSPSRVP